MCHLMTVMSPAQHTNCRVVTSVTISIITRCKHGDQGVNHVEEDHAHLYLREAFKKEKKSVTFVILGSD